MAVLANNLPENEPPPRVSLRAGQESRRPVHAQACRFSGGRSANRSMYKRLAPRGGVWNYFLNLAKDSGNSMPNFSHKAETSRKSFSLSS
jgi:hypothetical protein